ncbi:MAG: hypothetical protein ACYC4B_24615 [Pirellulaceae bacterium]
MRKVPLILRVTGGVHILALLGVACLVPDGLPLWAYGAIGSVWLLLLLASVELIQGRRIGIKVITVSHCVLFVAVLSWFSFVTYHVLTMNDPDGRQVGTVIYFVLPQALLAMTISGLMLYWMFRIRTKHARGG